MVVAALHRLFTGIYGAPVKMMARRMFGAVPDAVGVLWHHPAVLKDLMGFGRNRGLDEAKAREVPRRRESAAFTPLERSVMEYAEAMSQTPPDVTDELSAALLAELGAPALVELTARSASMNLTARTNVALGNRSQGFVAPRDALKHASSRGPSPSLHRERVWS